MYDVGAGEKSRENLQFFEKTMVGTPLQRKKPVL